MKSLIVLFLLFFGFVGDAQIINFPDANFKNALVNKKCVDTDGNGFGDTDADLNNDGEIDVSEALSIKNLIVRINSITNLDGITFFKNLLTVDCSSNQIVGLNLRELTKLDSLTCHNNRIASVSFPFDLKKLNCSSNFIDSLDLSTLTKLIFLDCSHNRLFHLDLSKNKEIKALDCSSSHNVYKLKSITFNNNINIKTLFLIGNDIKEIDFKETPNLINLYLTDNHFGNLDFSSLSELRSLTLGNSDSTYQIKVNGLQNLTSLTISGISNLKNIDVSTLTNLTSLYCRFNSLEELNIEKNINLTTLYCDGNRLKVLDIQNNYKIKQLFCSSNLLEYLFIKNGNYNLQIEFLYNPGLKYVCCDEFKLNNIRFKCDNQNQKNAEVNSYCTFKPGGKFYILNGENKYDEGLNGCDEIDIKVPNYKYHITNGSISGTFISNSIDNFSIPLQEGIHTITPILQNPSYFEVTPSSFTVTFPSTSDTITQDFCITPKGIFHKTNITVLPLSPPARPGFEAKYKIVWENAGNQIESGTLNFTYDESRLDYIEATKVADIVADGIVKWNFSDLRPFEKREIIVTLKINRPTDTPAVNAGEKLYLNASILDNIFTLENTVVGSYDPNDKTCLQGDRIHPDQIGKYVDFLIRFENTGNYAAENIVVKDIIDTKKFDVSSLQITDASHEVYARIEGNKVEFIFEKIQLPFDDASNDGYIAFKIKTLPTLTVGDSLKNLADIYFDYNFPIRTNETKSKLAFPVGTDDEVTQVKVFPNPVTDILTLEIKDDGVHKIVHKIEIFDLQGRIIRSVTSSNNSIDVSHLESGTYILKLHSQSKMSHVRFIKK